ncbi:LemA family protein [Halobacteriales archaeon Cl-PHB]
MVVYIVGGFVALVLLVLGVAYVVSIYNQLVSLRKRVEQAKQNIDVLLKQRQDELSKLIDAVSEYMDHEESVLVQLTEAREQARQASSPTEQANADQQIRGALADLRARVEDYPELRSQTNMLQFQERITDLESQIADRREFNNSAVTQYNTRIAQFPYVLFANPMGYQEAELFTATEEETADVDIGEAFA